MSQSERKLGGLFRLLKLEQDSSHQQLAEEPEANFQYKPKKVIPFWRADLNRRDMLAWLAFPSIPLTALVVAAFRVNIGWDGKPTYPATPTRVNTMVPTPTPILRVTTTSNLIEIPTSTPTLTPDKPSRTEILINSQ